MSRKKMPKPQPPRTARAPVRVRLPGLLVANEVGLGDAIKHLTFSVGIKPCGGCERRAAALNRWVVFSR